jgi:hypothetical protein
MVTPNGLESEHAVTLKVTGYLGILIGQNGSVDEIVRRLTVTGHDKLAASIAYYSFGRSTSTFPAAHLTAVRAAAAECGIKVRFGVPVEVPEEY